MSTLRELDQKFYKHRYVILFLATILQVFLISFFPTSKALFINELTFSFFMLANINLLRHSRKIVIFVLLFAVISILLVWIPDESQLGKKFFPYEKLIIITFILAIIYQIFAQIKKSDEVGGDLIFGAITIYILFGVLAGESNQLIYFFDLTSFSGNIDPGDSSDLKYYSYVTMTTLGYGDIAPVSQMARATAVFFSLAGQIYLAVIVALIVGKYVSHSDRNESKKD